ncbi:MAG: glycosidase [Ignavibacteriaceae bacterium]|nr:glycosidase [Ignavibacteriaceae bacterium]
MTLNQSKSSWFKFIIFILFITFNTINAQVDRVSIVQDNKGTKLVVNGKDFMVIGMNWDYFPIGTNYTYSLWTQPDNFIKAALDREMSLLKNMGVNVIRQYSGVQPKWIEYIYRNYGIYTVLNHSFGRYGVTVDGVYIPNTDYADPKTRAQILTEVKVLAEEFKNVPGLLMWLLGNENNYGLFWGGAETEDIPVGETLESVRARHMYNLFSEGIAEIKKIDPNHPIAICNGDLLFLDIIAEEIKNMDVFGTNVYRGVSFGDMFDKVKEKLNVPILMTEFGSDAFNAVTMREDQYMQARYALENWKEIFENAYGNGKTGNSIGGMTFQFSDGWWKYLQESNLSVHDNNASWSNGGYSEDYIEGENNMNEEWFGICAKGPTDEKGFYELYPRAAYYALKDAYTIDPLDEKVDAAAIRAHFDKISPTPYILMARGDKAALESSKLSTVRLSGLRLEFETFSTGGSKITTPDKRVDGSTEYPAFLGFDHMQSFYAEFESQPSANITAKVALNFLANVPSNPIDEIFYENRGRPKTVLTPDGRMTLEGIERVKVYRASMQWDHSWFKLDGFYRTGHYHWGYEGDFFGLYPESNYGNNIDIYNGSAPLGFEITGKKELEGLKIAFGPELWWGANPAILLKYSRKLGPLSVTGIYHEDLDEQGQAVSSFAVPLPPTRRATLSFTAKHGIFGVEAGGIWSGSNKKGETFQIVTGTEDNYKILQDQIQDKDAFGGKLKLTIQSGIWNWYAEGSVQGLVADGGVNQTLTFTGWRLKNSGRGNQYSLLTGIAITMGDFQIAPNFMWQKPIEGPIPNTVPAPGRPRNILSDPFAVLGNRETTAGELLITYDPTPATWMYNWDSDIREDANLAVSAGVVFRHHPTTRDAAIGILGDGRTIFAFPGAPPARDLWEFHSRIVSKLGTGFGMIANIYAGEGEPNGSDQRLIHRYGGDIRLAMNSFRFIAQAKINDWGPYDYHRDFNLTYPLQLVADLSVQLGKQEWFDLPSTRLGIRGTWRSLDQYSPRYNPTTILNVNGVPVPDPKAQGFSNGDEWEIRTYLHFNLGM